MISGKKTAALKRNPHGLLFDNESTTFKL